MVRGGGVQGSETITVLAEYAGKNASRGLAHTVTFMQAVSEGANFPCAGGVLGWNPKDFYYTIPAYSRVKKAQIWFEGWCDDECLIFLNDSKVPTARDGTYYKDGGATMYHTLYNSTINIALSNQTFKITTGTYNWYKGSRKAKISFRVTLTN